MKCRILFVDDEPMVLQGLQRMLRPLRAEWEMSFASSGAEALAQMAQTPFDVVVSDMRMPGMNGAELLNQVMQLYPQTVRLILSGHADKELILRCVGSTHQYLSKPCEPEDLKATIQRATNLEASLKSERLRQLAGKMECLPSIPRLYSEIVRILQDPDAALEEIGALVARDLAMTAKILKLANSAFFGLHREVSSPADAVSYLGLETLKSLVLALHAFSQYESVRLPGFSLEALWSHSQATAAAAKAIAQFEDADHKLCDEAFVAGLLHDSGKLVLAANLPEQYAQVLAVAADRRLSLAEAEVEIFGANHAELGGYLLGLWGLPVPVVEAIALHHAPRQCSHKVFSPLTAVHAANALVRAEQAGTWTDWAARMDTEYLAALGLAARLEQWQERCCRRTHSHAFV